MLFLTAFFFFMSGNNNVPQAISIDEDGKIVPRVTELDVAKQSLEEYRGWLNGTSSNWTEVSSSSSRAQNQLIVVCCTCSTT
jgi:hypothetical protein